MAEARNLVGKSEPKALPKTLVKILAPSQPKIDKHSHVLHQKHSPVLGPAASASGHQPTPVAGVAKPKAKSKKLIQAVVREQE